MKADELIYKWHSMNSGNVEVSTGTHSDDDWSVTINVDFTNDTATLDYMSKKELVELGEMLIEIGKSK
jgi:hypothetical protein